MEQPDFRPSSQEENISLLAIHIRRLRQWYKEAPLTQEKLATLAGVSVNQIRTLEAGKKLPQMIETFLSIALALKLPMEMLISEDILEQKAQSINERRDKLDPSSK